MHLIFHLPTVAERASPLLTWDSPWPNPPACLKSQVVRPHPKLRKQLDRPLILDFLPKACTLYHHIPPVNPEPLIMHKPLEAIRFPGTCLTGTATQSLAMSRMAEPPRLRNHSSVPPCTRLTGSAARPCRSGCMHAATNYSTMKTAGNFRSVYHSVMNMLCAALVQGPGLAHRVTLRHMHQTPATLW